MFTEGNSVLIEVKGLSKRYKSYKGEELDVFKNLNFTIKEKNIYLISGKSGSGKSTLLNILSTMDNEFEGSVYYKIDKKNIDLKKLSDSQRAKFRNEYIGFIFQSYELIDELNIIDNCTLPLMIGKNKNNQSLENAEHMLIELGIEKKHHCKFPRELSGGQQQRVGIARAVIKNPKIIFADEPTGNLDDDNKMKVLEKLLNLSKNSTIIIVTHELAQYKEFFAKYSKNINTIQLDLNAKNQLNK